MDSEAIAIHANHINMVKFASKEDSGYKAISRHLQLMVRDADGKIKAEWEKERQMDMRE